MFYDGKIWIGKSGEENIYVYPGKANRHGLIAGATGTGKTVTLKVMAESFSDAGVPVFLADAKGDLSGMCSDGILTEDMQKRIDFFGLDEAGFAFKNYPTNFWDVYGETGIPLRTTISEMGPLLLSRIMDLNDTQTDILNVIFKIADDNSLLLIDTKDLKSMLTYVSENSKELSSQYGNLPTVSLNAILRSVIALESDGGEQFFAEPALNIKDWLTVDGSGRGFIQILNAQKLMLNPRMYSMFLLWMISELYETLPEAGDLDKPKMVFFFDEAHMLFDSAPKILLEKIEQVVKLIRSKGVGIYFVTQNPRDIPDGVLNQLGNKVQHALRAYTPKEQQAMRAAVQGLRENPEFDSYTALSELGTGEALVSVLDDEGVPTIVKRTKILPPQSRMGIVEESVRQARVESAMLYGKYNYYVDNESAYERLTAIKEERDAVKAEEERLREQEKAEAEAAKQAEKERIAAEKQAEKERIAAEKQAEKERIAAEKEEAKRKAAAEKAEAAKKNTYKRAAKSVASSTAGTLGREAGNLLGKSVGGTFGKRIGGNVGASLARGIIGTLFK
ncbi:MAG: DUF853 domain-containing protein [Lachnospiraceae bacterium]|nr:DUF853 domain-containing protein [Lachnospiraceae bacterium]